MKNLNSETLKQLYQHSWSQNHGDNSDKETQSFWNGMAKKYSAKAHSQAERASVIDFLSRFAWNENESVLDVASGPGTYAIPVAKLVKQVTAIDFSEEMLKALAQQAKEESVENISQVHGRWLEVNLTDAFDTVLCLNCLGVIATDRQRKSRLAEALSKLKNATKKRLIILIPHADGVFNLEMRKALNLDEIPLERQRVAALYAAMVDNGMLPDLQILSRPFRWRFANIEEACETLLKKSGLESDDKIKSKLYDYLENKLSLDESNEITLSWSVSQALYTWHKD